MSDIKEGIEATRVENVVLSILAYTNGAYDVASVIKLADYIESKNSKEKAAVQTFTVVKGDSDE